MTEAASEAPRDGRDERQGDRDPPRFVVRFKHRPALFEQFEAKPRRAPTRRVARSSPGDVGRPSPSPAWRRQGLRGRLVTRLIAAALSVVPHERGRRKMSKKEENETGCRLRGGAMPQVLNTTPRRSTFGTTEPDSRSDDAPGGNGIGPSRCGKEQLSTAHCTPTLRWIADGPAKRGFRSTGPLERPIPGRPAYAELSSHSSIIPWRVEPVHVMGAASEGSSRSS